MVMRTKTALAASLLVVATVSCGSIGARGTLPDRAPAAVKSGRWGGQHIAMTVAASKTDIEFDCGAASIPSSLDADGGGAFSASGTFQPERPGPTSPDAPAPRPLRMTGSVKGDDMQVTIVLTDSGEAIGDFSLTLGAASRLVKCR
jgi:hypothetical protein